MTTLIMGQPLNASKIFSSMTVFDLLRWLHLVPVSNSNALTRLQGQYRTGLPGS
ncbi:hypothetical protein K438DRAFT_1876347, partial [Mycena galopus ATCC 62051]